MKEAFISNSMNIIKKYYPDYSEVKLAELRYGLLGLYLLITKSIIIFAIAYFLGIFKELLIFTLIYNLIRPKYLVFVLSLKKKVFQLKTFPYYFVMITVSVSCDTQYFLTMLDCVTDFNV